MKDGTIVIRRPGTADAPLVPFAPDIFTRGFGNWNEAIPVRFEFKRDGSGRVTHFTVSRDPARIPFAICDSFGHVDYAESVIRHGSSADYADYADS